MTILSWFVTLAGKNPNVMFELGLRLAFDKPTVIVKDDVTAYSFDTAPIEHLVYPRDLRYAQIVEFQRVLAEKVRATHERATSDPAYTTFLKHFGEFTVASINTKEVPGQEYIIAELKEIQQSMRRLEAITTAMSQSRPSIEGATVTLGDDGQVIYRHLTSDDVARRNKLAHDLNNILKVRLVEPTSGVTKTANTVKGSKPPPKKSS